MSWQLPEVEHQTYRRNTLEVVVCQLRFDPILKLQPRLADLQEGIRSRFPRYRETEGQQFELDTAVGRVRARPMRTFSFGAKGEPTDVDVGDQAVTLSYRNHRDRSVLFADAGLVFGTFGRVFAPVSPVRLGLRYVNLIDREAIERDLGRSTGWPDLLTPGFLAMPANLTDLVGTRFVSEISSTIDGGSMTIRHGLVNVPDRTTPVFRLDTDRYQEEDLDVSRVPSLLERFADDVYRVFRAAAGPGLLDWMSGS